MKKFDERKQCEKCRFNDEPARMDDRPCCTYGGRLQFDFDKGGVCLCREIEKNIKCVYKTLDKQ